MIPHRRRLAHRTSASRIVAAGLVAVVLTACGSTVQVRSAESLGQDGLGPGGMMPTDGAKGGPAFAGASLGSSDASLATDGGAGLGAVESATPGQQQGPAPTAAAEAAAGSPPLARNEPIRIGIIHTPGIERMASAVGIKGLTTGDTEAQAKAVIGWISAHGGLGGHPIKVFDHELDPTGGAAEFQAACTKMTQDYKVRYVVAVVALVSAPEFLPCLAKAGVGLLDDGTGLSDKTMVTFSHALANPGEIAPGRTMSVLVDDLWKRGWLTADSKVGIFANDSVDGHQVVDGALTAALRKHGLTAASTQYVNIGDAGASQANSVALQFRSKGVDRVIPVLVSPLFLMQSASSQGYHPAYALYSVLGPGALLETAAPRDQLRNAAGIGYQPFMDIGRGTKHGPVSARETLCFDIMERAGQTSTSPTTRGFQVQVCNVLFYLKDLSDRQPTVPRNLLSSGRPLIGKSFVPADTFRVDVTRRTDGVAAYRSLAYRDDCSCFQYVSPLQPTP